ncbi:asparagine synthase-related protein [Frankia sp. AgB32]|uniref:asparagine synthase-related protein n=1 Tax=Frankia sp. AgB32 TaxID=631119 RepID=UPI00200BA2E1|nr:asparagine synthase-related protein [Frankia sp. AgB32]MCK9897615.1 asparagine synthase-related protein [Frankia sp. AgB32]
MTTFTVAHRRDLGRSPSRRPTCWFVVLADQDPVVTPAGARHRLCYRSGRPWIVGDWPDSALVSATTGRGGLALIGCAAVSASGLRRLLVSARDVHDLDVGHEVAGDYHVVAEIDGVARVQGSATGTRRIFTTRLAGRVVAADRADVLAELTGAGLDRTALALALLDPSAPYPLDDIVPWTSIDALAPDHYLVVDRDGRDRQVRWWRQPAPILSRAQGAPILRAAMAEAVGARVAAGRTVSADLSGGLDSTSVCCLAARGPAEIVAVTGLAHDPGHDDRVWAARAAAAMPGITWEILPAADLPLVFDGIATADEPLDRPFGGIVDRAKLRASLLRVALYDPRLHLTGFGGDEIAVAAPNYLADLLARRPLTAVRHLRGHRAQDGWPWAASARMLRRRDYQDCLGDMARALAAARRGDLRGGRGAPYVTALDWTMPPVVPGWLTGAALDLVAEAFAQAAARAVPLAPTRSGHADMFAIRAGAATFRLFDQIADAVGPPLAAPLLDERVVRAALAVRPAERASPEEYKPLLKEAMRPVVPAAALRRCTKADASAEEYRGLRANQDVLVKLCDDSPLADLGLIEPAVLREACRQGAAPDHRAEALQPTIATDVWLRTLGGVGRP